MQKNRWSRNFDWLQTPATFKNFSGVTFSGFTYYQQNRLEQYNQNRFIAVGDIYFKLNKYLTGITFSYINSLNDIYKRDLLTGDGYSIVNMYNEYDVIDRVMKNIVFVDVSSNTNVDLNLQWTKIDGVKLKPGHLVLLSNQDSEFENDIYKVTPQFFLVNAGLLASRKKSDKFTCSVKLGSNADKQFFLLNNGLEFPMYSEPKYFIEGKSFLLKNLIKYNLYNTSTNSGLTSKIIFTDYEFARKQLTESYNLFTECTLDLSATTVTESYFKISYHHDEYIIRTGLTNTSIGSVTGITNTTFSLGSIFPYDEKLNPKVGDQVQVKIFDPNLSGSSNEFLTMKSFIKSINTSYDNIIDGGNSLAFDYNGGTSTITGTTIIVDLDGGESIFIYDGLDGGNSTTFTPTSIIDGGSSTPLIFLNNIILEESIPNNILGNLKNYYYEIRNLNVATSWVEAINYLQYTTYTDFYTLTGTVDLIDGGTSIIPFDSTIDSVLDSVNDEFLDGGSSIFSLGSITFTPRESPYDRYFDYNGIVFYAIDDTVSIDFYTNIQYIQYNLFDRLNQINSTIFTSSFSGISNSYTLPVTNYKYTDNNRIRITTPITGLTNIFKPYTYVNATSTTESIEKTLIYSVKDYEIVIEKPANWTVYPTDNQSPVITSIQNIDGLQNISDILYEVYMNVNHTDWDDNLFGWYIQKSDNERKYICKAYAELLVENQYFRDNVTGILYENDNNEFILKLYDLETDYQLQYSPIELVYLGGDRKTRLPVTLKKIKSTEYTLDSDWNVLNGGGDDEFDGDFFDFGLNVVLGGPNYLPPSYTLINGNG